MNKKDFKIGQVVYIDDKDIIPVTIETLGNKYFTVKCFDKWNRFSRYKFSYETMREVTEYCAKYFVYITEQEIKDKKEKIQILDFLQDNFDHYNRNKYTLDQLKRIKQIIEEGVTK